MPASTPPHAHTHTLTHLNIQKQNSISHVRPIKLPSWIPGTVPTHLPDPIKAMRLICQEKWGGKGAHYSPQPCWWQNHYLCLSGTTASSHLSIRLHTNTKAHSYRNKQTYRALVLHSSWGFMSVALFPVLQQQLITMFSRVDFGHWTNGDTLLKLWAQLPQRLAL